MSKIYQMGIDATLDVISGKWKPIVLCNLGHASLRSGELKRRMPDVTQKVLTQQLRELERAKIITRTTYNQVPPKVVYALSEKGKSLRDILISMSVWGENYIKQANIEGEDVTLEIKEYDGFTKM